MINESRKSSNKWDSETVSLLALSLLKGVGYWTLYKLASFEASFSDIFKGSTSFDEFGEYFNRSKVQKPKVSQEDWSAFQANLWAEGNSLYKKLKQANIKVRHFDEPDFPQSLKAIPDPPKWLFIQGDERLLHKKNIAIVGTRKPTDDGSFLAVYVGACMAYFDTATVSGLAYGIDQIIHKQSIRFQVPTIAVLGTGIFLDYPAGSGVLRHDILINGGAIVTEYLPYQSYSAQNFVRRNRIQAGLSEIIIPVQWRAKSGTAHTVRYAVEGRKKVICLKLPDWSSRQNDSLILAEELRLPIYTIPGEEEKLLEAVAKYILRVREIEAQAPKTIKAEDKEDSSEAKIETINQLPLF